MASAAPTCGSHTAQIVERGTHAVILAFTSDDLVRVSWERLRDETSNGWIWVDASGCCDDGAGTTIADIRTIRHELQILRDGILVWTGPITRIEYEFDTVRVYAEDMLWIAKRTAIEVGYDYETNSTTNVELARILIEDKTFAPNGDPWGMVPNLTPLASVSDSTSAKIANNFQFTTYQELDNLAQFGGLDYTVTVRDISWWDNRVRHPEFLGNVPPLLPDHLSRYPVIVEYAAAAATRVIRTDGSGFASIATNLPLIPVYGQIDQLNSSNPNVDPAAAPTPAMLAAWLDSAENYLALSEPPQETIRVSDGSTLMPESAWDVDTVKAGDWIDVDLRGSALCRELQTTVRLHRMVVTEQAETGELVRITTIAVPNGWVDP